MLTSDHRPTNARELERVQRIAEQTNQVNYISRDRLYGFLVSTYTSPSAFPVYCPPSHL